jgi:hypothetical protein
MLKKCLRIRFLISLIIKLDFLLIFYACQPTPDRINVIVNPTDEQNEQNKLFAKIIEQLAMISSRQLDSQEGLLKQGLEVQTLFNNLITLLTSLNTSSTITNQSLERLITHAEALTKPNSPLMLSLARIEDKLTIIGNGLGGLSSLAGIGPQLTNVIAELTTIKINTDTTNTALVNLGVKMDATTAEVKLGTTTIGNKIDSSKAVLDAVNTAIGNVNTELNNIHSALTRINTQLLKLDGIKDELTIIKNSLRADGSIGTALATIKASIDNTNTAIGALTPLLNNISTNTAAITAAINTAKADIIAELAAIKTVLETGNVGASLKAIEDALKAGGTIPTALTAINNTLTGEIKTALNNAVNNLGALSNDSKKKVCFDTIRTKAANADIQNAVTLLMDKAEMTSHTIEGSYIKFESSGKGLLGPSSETNWMLVTEVKAPSGNIKYFHCNYLSPNTVYGPNNNMNGRGFVANVLSGNDQQYSFGHCSNTFGINPNPKWGTT